jgi:prevent-host-death family protein
MKNLTATEAARHFADVLDAVEHDHETFVVTRGGRAVASIGPAGGAGGRGLKQVLLRHRPDAAWHEELKSLREGLVAEERNWRG